MEWLDSLVFFCNMHLQGRAMGGFTLFRSKCEPGPRQRLFLVIYNLLLPVVQTPYFAEEFPVCDKESVFFSYCACRCKRYAQINSNEEGCSVLFDITARERDVFPVYRPREYVVCIFTFLTVFS